MYSKLARKKSKPLFGSKEEEEEERKKKKEEEDYHQG